MTSNRPLAKRSATRVGLAATAILAFLLTVTVVTTISGSTAVASPSNLVITSPLAAVPQSADETLDTNYTPPGNAIYVATNGLDTNSGTLASPYLTIAKAIAVASSGATIVVRGGTYREGSTNSIAKSFTIQNYPHEQVWMDGADVTSGWLGIGGGIFTHTWSTPSFCGGHYYDVPYASQNANNTGPCTHIDMALDPTNPAAGDPQMVFKNGTPLTEVTSQGAVTATTFYYDQSAQKLYLGFNPLVATVEAAARPNALVLQGGSGNVTVRGIGFRHYATNEYSANATHGAVLANEPNITFDHVVFTQQAGAGLHIADPRGASVTSSYFYMNGNNGLDSNGHQHSTGAVDGLVVSSNNFDGNNTELFGTGCSTSCASAGSKMAHMDGFTLKGNIFQNAYGNGKGFWCDLACSNGVMVDNLFRNNGDTGLMYEVSDTGIIASNLIYGNGKYGLKLSAANTAVYNNTFSGNLTNVLLYDDDRTLGVGGWTDVGPDTTNVTFFNNILSGGTTAEVSAWRTTATSPNTGPNTFIASMDYNSYFRPSSSPATLIDWRDGSTNSYTSVSSFRTARNFDNNGQDVTTASNPFFTAPGSGDYSVPTASAASGSATVVPSNIANAIGIGTGQTTDRGALVYPGSPASSGATTTTTSTTTSTPTSTSTTTSTTSLASTTTSTTTTTTSVPGYSPPSTVTNNTGYRIASASGSATSFLNASAESTHLGSLNFPIVGIASTPTGNGYWLVATDGGVFAYGDAKFFGSTGSIKLNKPIVGMASTPTGNGYWLVASDGGIFAYGDAPFFGSTGSIKLNKPIVGMSATKTGAGYWLVASDGGIFAFGDAPFWGSTGAMVLNRPVVGMATTVSGGGYWLVASDGGIFAFGDAPFWGSTGAIKLNQPITGMARTSSGAGYWLVARDGGIFAFGNATFLGSTASAGATDVVGISRA